MIFNAYNVESDAKAAILTDAKVSGADRIIADVEALERDLVRSATGVTTTTAEDAAILQRWTDRPITVAHNGTVASDSICVASNPNRSIRSALRSVRGQRASAECHRLHDDGGYRRCRHYAPTSASSWPAACANSWHRDSSQTGPVIWFVIASSCLARSAISR